MSREDLIAEERTISNALENVCTHDYGVCEGNGYIEAYVLVSGDWKHDHLRCKYIMNELGYTLDSENVLEDTGCDWYPAEYTFIRKVG